MRGKKYVLIVGLILVISMIGCKSKLDEYKESYTGYRYITDMGTDNGVEESKDVNLDVEVDANTIFEGAVNLDVELIYQNPELPTGCEITSLAIVLNYLGISVDKCDLADNYLEKYEHGPGDFYNHFCGNPRSSGGYGCYANVIYKASQKYIRENNLQLEYRTKNLTNCEVQTLYSYLTDGYPIVAWTTNNLEEPYVNEEWDYNGKHYEWLVPEHCVVIMGYDIEKNIIKIVDPQNGYLEQDLVRFIDVWKMMGFQAVTVERIDK